MKRALQTWRPVRVEWRSVTMEGALQTWRAVGAEWRSVTEREGTAHFTP
jgi:hypothetical protein